MTKNYRQGGKELKLIKRKKDKSGGLLVDFLRELEEEGFSLRILDEKKIKNNYGKGLFGMLADSLRESGFEKFSIIFDEKELRISWFSDYDPDRIVVNVARKVGTPEFRKAIKKTAAELRQIELEMRKLDFK